MPIKPSENESVYFARQELERLKKLQEENKRRQTNEERAQRKQLHYMHCPKCGSDMAEIQFHSVTIDKCHECGGLFFDKGELESAHAKESGFLSKVLSVFQ